MASLFRDQVLANQTDRLYGEVVLRQSFSTRLFTLAVVAIIAAATIFVSFGKYSRIETASGVLVPSGQSSKIFALKAGVISALWVKDGAIVTSGQKLALVSSDQPNADGVRYTEEGVAAIGAQEGLARKRIRLAGELAATSRSRLEATLNGLLKERDNLFRDLTLQQQTVESSRSIFEQIGPVAAKGYVSKIEVERRRQSYINAQQQEARLRTQLSQMESQIAQTQADLAHLSVEEVGQVVDAQTTLESYRQEKSRLESERSYSITAPISGRVTALQAATGKTVGGTVPLMTIIPDGQSLEANVYVASRAIGFVKTGQEVRLLYDAFPYQRFGSFKGKITSVSRVVLSPNELDVPLKINEAVYKVGVALDRQSVTAFGEEEPVQPGMTLTANIVLERQSFWDWLMAPLRAVTNRS